VQAEGVRTFRLDRIVEAKVGAPVSLPDELISASQSSANVAEVEIRESGRWVLDLVQVDAVSQGPDGNFHGEIQYRDPDWLVRIVLSAGGYLQVITPPQIRAQVAAAAAAALSAYS
jgi:predicted DNA-binding transcriptional regulator YafY